MASGVERENEVDHGKTGAHQERGPSGPRKFVHRGPRIGTPGVADEPLTHTRKRAQRFGLLVADSEDQRLRVDGRAIVEADVPPVTVAATADRRGFDQPGAAARGGLLQDLPEVTRKKAPLGEAAGVAACDLESLGKMIRRSRP